MRLTKRLVVAGVILAVIVATAVLGACGATSSPVPSQAGSVVEFTSTDPAAGVEIRVPDLGWDRPLGTTPFNATVSLPAGPHTYLATAPGYRTVSGQFTVTAALDPLHVQVPALARSGGQIEVRSSAPAQVTIDGQPAGNCAPNVWTPVGSYDPGRHTVQTRTALGTQEMTIAVGESSDGRADFYWGSRLVVMVEPAGLISLTVLADGQPYTGPMEYSHSRLAQQPFVHVEAAASGYVGWADTVFLQPGNVTTATITLTPDTREADVLAAYWHYWEVLTAAYQSLDVSQLSTVITGTLLEQETQAISTLDQYGIAAFTMEPAPHTPTVEIAGTTATVRVVFDLQQTTVQQDGSSTTYTNRQDGEYAFSQGADGIWRAAGWTSLAPAATVLPTPTDGGGGGDGGDSGSSQSGPADRGLVAQIILASINCLRAGQGLPAVAWDQEIANTLAPLADEATAAYRDSMAYPPELVARVDAALLPLGARTIGWKGIVLSFVPGNAQWGEFAYDWENYADRPCDTRYGTGGGEAWAGSFSRIGIAIGTPYWTGTWWSSTIIFAVR